MFSIRMFEVKVYTVSRAAGDKTIKEIKGTIMTSKRAKEFSEKDSYYAVKSQKSGRPWLKYYIKEDP